MVAIETAAPDMPTATGQMDSEVTVDNLSVRCEDKMSQTEILSNYLRCHLLADFISCYADNQGQPSNWAPCWNSTDTIKWYWEAEEYSLLRNKGLHCLKKEQWDIFLKIQHWLLGLHCLSFWKISIYGYADCKDERCFSQSISMYPFYDTIYFYETFY